MTSLNVAVVKNVHKISKMSQKTLKVLMKGLSQNVASIERSAGHGPFPLESPEEKDKKIN
jgi:hypothetical protein